MLLLSAAPQAHLNLFNDLPSLAPMVKGMERDNSERCLEVNIAPLDTRTACTRMIVAQFKQCIRRGLDMTCNSTILGEESERLWLRKRA
jgi:hypothetical protein